MTAPRRLEPPSPEDLARVAALAERRLPPEEFAAYVNAPMSEDERRGILELIEWFQRRYPTALERLAYARRAYETWRRAMPEGASGRAP